MSKKITVILLVAGAILTAIGQITHPWFDGFRIAASGLGFTLAALARSEGLVRKPNERSTDEVPALGDETTKPGKP